MCELGAPCELQARERNPTLERLDGTNEPLAKRRCCGNIRHLATGYCQLHAGLAGVSERLRLCCLRRDFSLPIPNPQLVRFAVGLTACGIELLVDLGKVIVASVQQIAALDSEQSR